MKAETSSSTAPREWTIYVCPECRVQAGEEGPACEHEAASGTFLTEEWDGESEVPADKDWFAESIVVVEKASLDRVVEERDELREALVLIRNYFPVAGTHVEVVGVEPDPSGDLRVYLVHRSRGLYVRITDENAQRQVWEAWNGAGRVSLPMPPAWALLQETPEPVLSDAGTLSSEPGGEAALNQEDRPGAGRQGRRGLNG